MEKHDHILSVEKKTDNRFLNMYDLQYENKVGGQGIYHIASRGASIEELKLKTHKNKPDGVIIYALYGPKRDKVVMVRQYRFSVDDYVYEFPAGLVEPGEEFHAAAVRELFEETGLHLTPIKADSMYERAYYTTIGMTDECCAAVYGYADGVPDTSHLEDSETLEVVIADRREAARILREENVALICAYMLMHFIHGEGDPLDFVKRIG